MHASNKNIREARIITPPTISDRVYPSFITAMYEIKHSGVKIIYPTLIISFGKFILLILSYLFEI